MNSSTTNTQNPPNSERLAWVKSARAWVATKFKRKAASTSKTDSDKQPVNSHDQARKSAGKTVIAHISDLHFSSKTKSEDDIFTALRDDILEHKIDVLVVTGDVVDSSIIDTLGKKGARKSYAQVLEFLVELCKQAKIDHVNSLLVVPGNHDFRMQGFLGQKQRLCDLFDATFGPHAKPRLFPNLGIAVYGFNSNSEERSLNFGNGRVSKGDLVDFSLWAKTCAETAEAAWAKCRTRVALVHHHPMPIPGMEHPPGMIDHEWFIVFKNAGMFLGEMIKQEVDLVLHGHKHYPAYSRASFPLDAGNERTISVAAAGSVGKGQPQPPSYNLVTVEDSGAITLERRVRTNATYHGTIPVALMRYDEIRRNRISRLAKDLKVKLFIEKATAVYHISDLSGDCVMEHTVDGVRSATGQPIAEQSLPLRTSAGRFAQLATISKTEGQSVNCEWRDDPAKPSEKVAFLQFDPPIQSNPVGYVRKTTVLNAFSFNQRERRDSSVDKRTTEQVRNTFPGITDSFVMEIIFPDGHMPDRFILTVEDETQTPHPRERDHVQHGLSFSKPDRKLTLRLRQPVPGYRYSVEWNLPKDEKEESNLSPYDAGIAEALIQKLLAQRPTTDSASVMRPGVVALQALQKSLLDSRILSGLAQDPHFDIALFTYDEAQGGLVCSCSLTKHDPASSLWKWLIKAGRTVNGRAYRRREPVLWFRVPKVTVADDAIYESLYEVQQGSLPKHTVILSIPLFYPLKRGRIAAILTYSSRSLDSQLLRLEEKALLAAVVEHSMVWYSECLIPTINGRPASPPPVTQS